MPFIDMGKEFKDAKETPLAPEGEYDLLCKAVDHNTTKHYVQVTIGIEGEDYKDFNHFVNLANPERDAVTDADKGREPGTTTRNKMLFVKRFLEAFSVPYEAKGFDPNDIPGASARLGLTQTVGTTGMRNQNINLPPLAEEG